MSKYFSLLRPFDIEAAKRGDLLCDLYGVIGWKYVAGPDCDGKIVTIHIETGRFISPQFPEKEFRMAPLAWVEGKPVYPGDVLYHKTRQPSPLTVDGLVDKDLLALKPSDAEHLCPVAVQWLTWNPPKVKKQGWINVYNDNYLKPGRGLAVIMWASEEEADAQALPGRIGCVCTEEWEE